VGSRSCRAFRPLEPQSNLCGLERQTRPVEVWGLECSNLRAQGHRPTPSAVTLARSGGVSGMTASPESGESLRSDSELIVASREEPQAFRELYDRWAQNLLAYFYRRARSAESRRTCWRKRSRSRTSGGFDSATSAAPVERGCMGSLARNCRITSAGGMWSCGPSAG
jgi:hypothetical protein